MFSVSVLELGPVTLVILKLDLFSLLLCLASIRRKCSPKLLGREDESLWSMLLFLLCIRLLSLITPTLDAFKMSPVSHSKTESLLLVESFCCGDYCTRSGLSDTHFSFISSLLFFPGTDMQTFQASTIVTCCRVTINVLL